MDAFHHRIFAIKFAVSVHQNVTETGICTVLPSRIRAGDFCGTTQKNGESVHLINEELFLMLAGAAHCVR